MGQNRHTVFSEHPQSWYQFSLCEWSSSTFHAQISRVFIFHKTSPNHMAAHLQTSIYRNVSQSGCTSPSTEGHFCRWGLPDYIGETEALQKSGKFRVLGAADLVGAWALPLWKIWVGWDDEIPNIWKVIKFMFQTTNQVNLVTEKTVINTLTKSTDSQVTRLGHMEQPLRKWDATRHTFHLVVESTLEKSCRLPVGDIMQGGFAR
jgi:hypothetical protein